MNYEKLYFAFIEKFKSQIIPHGTYTEVHHILPRYAGGSDDDCNLIRVTFHQHLFLHKLLWKAYRNPEDKCAIAIMGGTQDKRLAMLELAWAKNRGRKHTEQEKKRRSDLYKQRLQESPEEHQKLLDMNIKANITKKANSKEFWESLLMNAERNEEYLNKVSSKSKFKFVSPEGLSFDSPIYAAKYYGNVSYYVIENWCKRQANGWTRILKTDSA